MIGQQGGLALTANSQREHRTRSVSTDSTIQESHCVHWINAWLSSRSPHRRCILRRQDRDTSYHTWHRRSDWPPFLAPMLANSVWRILNSVWRILAVAVGRNVVVLFPDLPAGVAFHDPTGEALDCSGVDVGPGSRKRLRFPPLPLRRPSVRPPGRQNVKRFCPHNICTAGRRKHCPAKSLNEKTPHGFP